MKKQKNKLSPHIEGQKGGYMLDTAGEVSLFSMCNIVDCKAEVELVCGQRVIH